MVREWRHRGSRWLDLLMTEDEKERRKGIRRKEKEEELNENRDIRSLHLLIKEEEKKETRRKIS